MGRAVCHEQSGRTRLKVARKTGGYARAAVEHLTSADLTAIDPAERVAAQVLVNELRGYLPLMDRVIDQTTRRVFRGEQVPADEKVLSLFESHTDVIVKGSRAVVFGHKVCLTGGMNRCTWRSQHSLDSFRRYVWGCVLAFNAAVLARRLVAATA